MFNMHKTVEKVLNELEKLGMMELVCGNQMLLLLMKCLNSLVQTLCKLVKGK